MPAVLIAVVGQAAVVRRLVFPEHAEPLIPFGLLRWLLPGTWSWRGDDGYRLTDQAPGTELLTRAGAVLLVGVLCGLLLRVLARRTLPALAVTGAAAALIATTVAELLSGAAANRAQEWGVGVGEAALWFAPGALTAGALGGVAAWTVLRRTPLRPPPGPGPAAAPGGPQSRDDDPGDELLITLSR